MWRLFCRPHSGQRGMQINNGILHVNEIMKNIRENFELQLNEHGEKLHSN